MIFLNVQNAGIKMSQNNFPYLDSVRAEKPRQAVPSPAVQAVARIIAALVIEGL